MRSRPRRTLDDSAAVQGSLSSRAAFNALQAMNRHVGDTGCVRHAGIAAGKLVQLYVMLERQLVHHFDDGYVQILDNVYVVLAEQCVLDLIQLLIAHRIFLAVTEDRLINELRSEKPDDDLTQGRTRRSTMPSD